MWDVKLFLQMPIFVEMLPFSNEKLPSFEQGKSRVAIEAVKFILSEMMGVPLF